MWGAIIASAATILAVLFMQGPIVALGLTVASSLAFLVALRMEERRMRDIGSAHQPLQALDGKSNDDVTLAFPPLRQRAS
jgi:uncharacterized membrane protein YdjX (TVP38/TMEM64 family)